MEQKETILDRLRKKRNQYLNSKPTNPQTEIQPISKVFQSQGLKFYQITCLKIFDVKKLWSKKTYINPVFSQWAAGIFHSASGSHFSGFFPFK